MSDTWTVGKVVRWATDDFKTRGIDTARLDAGGSMKRRPVHVQQDGESDCGPACLAAIVKFHGRVVDPEPLRERCGTNRDGTAAVPNRGGGLFLGLPAFGSGSTGPSSNTGTMCSSSTAPNPTTLRFSSFMSAYRN